MPVDLEPAIEDSEEKERQKERDMEILRYAKDTGMAHSVLSGQESQSYTKGNSSKVRAAETPLCHRKAAMRVVATQEPEGDFLSKGFGDRQIHSAG